MIEKKKKRNACKYLSKTFDLIVKRYLKVSDKFSNTKLPQGLSVHSLALDNIIGARIYFVFHQPTDAAETWRDPNDRVGNSFDST